tara:strand:- start:1492 stop:1839 length:348 start_codon:yes stop_codon:yes gene_type:complete
MSELSKFLEDNFTVGIDPIEAEPFCEALTNFKGDHYTEELYNWIMASDFTGCSEMFLIGVMMHMNWKSKDMVIGIFCHNVENKFRAKRNEVAVKLRTVAGDLGILKECPGIFDPD